jgi:hypothetical protein
MNETIKVTEDQARKLRSLKTALMQDLLTGRKRVTALLEPEPLRRLRFFGQRDKLKANRSKGA